MNFMGPRLSSLGTAGNAKYYAYMDLIKGCSALEVVRFSVGSNIEHGMGRRVYRRSEQDVEGIEGIVEYYAFGGLFDCKNLREVIFDLYPRKTSYCAERVVVDWLQKEFIRRNNHTVKVRLLSGRQDDYLKR